MATSGNNLDAFEQQLKDGLEHYEVPYNSSDWAQMERALASGVRGWGHGRALIAGLLLAGGLLIGGTAYYLGRDSSSTQVGAGTQATPPPAQNTKGMSAAAITAPEHGMAENGTEQPVGATGEAATPTAAAGASRAQAVSEPTIAAHQASTPPKAGGMAATLPAATSETAPATAFRSTLKEACPGSPVGFAVERMADDGIYLWNFGDGSFSNNPNPEHTFTKPGTYQVMLSMSSPGMGTIRNKPSSDMIVVHEAPSAAFNIIRMDHAGLVPSVHFESRAHGVGSYLWDFGDGTSSTEASPDHVYRKKGVYQVVQTVTNTVGCTDRRVKELRVEQDLDLGAAKSFTPAAGGKEGCFMPALLRELKTGFQLSVYDPGGALVYNTSNPDRPWLGKAGNNGPVLKAADYVWVADVKTGTGGTETFTGTVQLLP